MSTSHPGAAGRKESLSDEREFMRCPACARAFPLGDLYCAVDGTTLLPARGRTLLGRVLANRYRIQELLGSGGMGEVYKAWHLLLEKPLALKVVLPSLADRSTAVALLRREARNASRVEHANVVRVYDLEFDAGLLFLTMDYVPGPTLMEVVRSTGPQHPALIAEIVEQVAYGLEAIHAMGIVHRDLKPSNVVLTRASDGRPVAKLLDFGISRAFDDPDQSITRSGLVVGTPVFMSPEQRSGLALDRRADVFALGVLATYLLAGKLPRIGPATCLRVSDVPEAAAWPDRVRHVLLLAMMWERSQRATSALSFATMFRDAVANFEPSQGTPSIEALLSSGTWSMGSDSERRPTPAAPVLAGAGGLMRTSEVGRVTPQQRSATPAPSAGRALTGPRVVATAGPLAGREYPVGTEPLCIGRDPQECRIAFPESASLVSRIHASLAWNPGSRRFVLRDEGSKNTTCIGANERLEPGVDRELDPGMTFSVGHPDFRFQVIVD